MGGRRQRRDSGALVPQADSEAVSFSSADADALPVGVHVVLWLPSLRPTDELSLVTAARQVGVGAYPVSTLFASPESLTQPRPAGFIPGYASLTVAQIEQGLQALGSLLST